jgi:hypothetical protein
MRTWGAAVWLGTLQGAAQCMWRAKRWTIVLTPINVAGKGCLPPVVPIIRKQCFHCLKQIAIYSQSLSLTFSNY